MSLTPAWATKQDYRVNMVEVLLYMHEYETPKPVEVISRRGVGEEGD
jgi:hypothetical protein